jgi:hypothetical protein
VAMTAAAVDDSVGGQRWGQSTTGAMDEEGTQDWAADYNGERTTVASNAGDRGVGMMTAMVEDGGSR